MGVPDRDRVRSPLGVARSWAQDRVLRRVARNSSYLLVSNVISAVLSIVTANLLGAAGFGVLGGITAFVSNVNRLFSFRMGDVVVRYMGAALARGEKERAAALVKAAGLAETVTSLLAFVVMLALAPLAARYFAKDASTASLFVLYSFIILANFATETANGVIQVTGHYRSQALINLAQSVLTAGLIVLAYINRSGLEAVVWAYLLGKVILGFSPIVLALYWLRRELGAGWLRVSLAERDGLLPPRKELVRYAISTNLSGTVNMLARDSEVLWVNLLLSPLAGGYYKAALAVINLVTMPVQPFITTTFPEIAKAVTQKAWQRLRRLLGRISAIAAAWTGAVALGLALLGGPVLFGTWNVLGRVVNIYDAQYLPALPVLMVLLIGYGVANILFWNRPLLLSLGLADTALWVGLWTMLAKTMLTVLLVPRFGYLAEAWLLSAYFVISIGLMAWRGLREVRRAEQTEPVASAA